MAMDDAPPFRHSASTVASGGGDASGGGERLSGTHSTASCDLSTAKVLDNLMSCITTEFELFHPPPRTTSDMATARSWLTSMHDSLGEMREKSPIMYGPLLKLNSTSDQSWKNRFFLLSRDAKLFLFKPNPTLESLPITYIPVERYTAMSNPLYKSWIVHVEGSGVTVEGVVQKRVWTLKASSAAELKLLEEALDTLVMVSPKNKNKSASLYEQWNSTTTTTSGLHRETSTSTAASSGSQRFGALPLLSRNNSRGHEDFESSGGRSADPAVHSDMFPAVHKTRSNYTLLRKPCPDSQEVANMKRVSESQLGSKFKSFEMPKAATVEYGLDLLEKQKMQEEFKKKEEAAERERQELSRLAAAEEEERKKLAAFKAAHMPMVVPYASLR
ncbi:hypothetical protein CcCBS67573_g01998 [Chytriomyces confervae]|uniref:PH domain-containing protein n=1 Tax=Chytriomyces confervae TaxID=246404 RepID=A0A507FJX6_9FUNG|nr:hypothetical protein CcCBS67573_g01998 [Chytriomyces confervae]